MSRRSLKKDAVSAKLIGWKRKSLITSDGFDLSVVGVEKRWENGFYRVFLTEEPHARFGHITHLSISRLDGKPIRSWSHMQAIKNRFAGPERIGFEYYPRQSEIVDAHNAYHIYVLPEDAEDPIGLGLRGLS